MLAPSGKLHSLPGSTFYSSAVQTLVEPELLARGYAGVLRVFHTKSISRRKKKPPRSPKLYRGRHVTMH